MKRIELDSKTSLYALLGDPVEHSLSPAIQNRAFLEKGLNSIYLAMQVKEEDLREALLGAKALGMKGFNVTIPHKERVLPYLDRVSPEAQEMGAVNTIRNQEGELVGYNTDGRGFVAALKRERLCSLVDKKILILGAGGAARGVILQLLKEDIGGLTIINRNEERLKDLLASISSLEGASAIRGLPLQGVDWRRVLLETDLLIHTTSVGMYPHANEGPLAPPHFFHKNLLVVDMVYNPMMTTLLQGAKRMGCSIFGGWGMLLYQGALAFEIWTGEEAPIEGMKEALFGALRIDEEGGFS